MEEGRLRQNRNAAVSSLERDGGVAPMLFLALELIDPEHVCEVTRIHIYAEDALF